MENWDDLRIIAEVLRQGSFSAASKKLVIDHSTVLRRVRAFEKSVGVTLFQKSNRGLVLTESGERLVPLLAQVEDSILHLQRQLEGRNQEIGGDVLVTTTDTIALTALPETIASLRSKHPQLQVFVQVSNAMANLNRAEADIAIRPTNEPPESYIGRRLGKVFFQIYASESYAARFQGRSWEDIRTEAQIIAFDSSLADLKASKWLEPQLTKGQVMRTNSVLSATILASQSLGCAMLPNFMPRFFPGLKALDPRTEIIGSDLWILTHRDVMRTRRIQETFTHLADQLPALLNMI